MVDGIARLLLGAAVLSASLPIAARADNLNTDPSDTTAAAQTSIELPAICTDRPTKSNAACTVELSHFQYEADVFNATFAHANGVTTDTYLITNPTLKYGVAPDIDVEVNIAPYVVEHTHDMLGHSSSEGGIGDLYLRLKDNFYNSADGKISVAVIPYVKAPTARLGIGDGAVEGGALLPINYKLTEKITLTTVPEIDILKDAGGNGRHVNTAQLFNIGYSLPNNVTVYGEIWSDWNFDPERTIRQYSVDAAVEWSFTKYLQFDVGVNFGLNHETPGVQPYVGVSQKF